MRIFKRIIITLILFIIVGFGGITSYIYLEQDEIEQMVISEISLQLKSSILIEDVSISAIKSFPFVSISLYNLTVFDAFQIDTLCQIEELSVNFNALDLYHQNYIIQNLIIKNGKTAIYYIDSAPNYEIWYADTTSKAENKLSIGLENIILENVEIEYRNSNMATSLTSHKSEIELAIDEQGINVDIEGDFTNNRFVYDKINYLANQPIKLDGEMLIESTGLKIASDIDVAQIPLTLDVSSNDQSTETKIKTSMLDLTSVLKIIPSQYLSTIEAFDIKGKSDLTIFVLSDHLSTPKIDINFTYENGFVKSKDLPFDLENINLKGKYTNGKKRNNSTSKVNLNNIKCQVNNELISADAIIVNLDNPKINTSLGTQIKLSQLESYGYKPPLDLISGTAQLELNYNGLVGLKNNIEYDLSMAEKKATVNIEDLQLKTDSTSPMLSKSRLNLNLVNNHLEIVSFKGYLQEKNDFEFIGAIDNLFSYFFLKNAPLKIGGTLTSKVISADDFMLENEAISEEQSESTNAIRFPEDITANIKINFEDITYDRLHLRNVITHLIYKDKKVRAKNIALETMSGNITADISLEQLRSGKLRLISTTGLENINVRQLFYELNNFGQETMRHKHLKGKITSEIYLRNEWDKFFNPIDEHLYSFIDVTIYDGELLEFEPMMLMSDYISVEELKRIKFSTLENQIEIKNNYIDIPFMEINSSATDIACAGTYSFDGQMDFDIKVLLNEILGNKFRRKNKKKVSEFEIIEQKNSKGMALFLKMEGTADNPKVSPNTFKLKETLNKGFKNEKRKLKDVIKNEFDETGVNQEIDNPDYNKIVEWEE